MDHRNLLDKYGKHELISKLPRNERRLLRKGGEKIARTYQSIMKQLVNSGSKLPVSEVLRSMVLEYTNRFASSGTNNQPISFNYFEPFCWAKLIPNSFAPYFKLKSETDHLFDLNDFFDFLTSSDIELDDVNFLADIPDSKTFHFSTSGDLFSTTVFDSNKREFVISGFSMVRVGDVVHWFILAGEVFSEREWGEMKSHDVSDGISKAPVWKRKFLEEMIERTGRESGLPLPLEGTERSWRTIIAGEFDFVKRKHISRAYFAETKNAFTVHCDDPEVFSSLRDVDQNMIAESTLEKMATASSLWNLAEGLFHLPTYFASRVAVPIANIDQGGLSINAKQKRGGKGLTTSYSYVKSLEIVDDNSTNPIVKVTLPHFEVETQGHWRRLDYSSFGKDEKGNRVQGKTWVQKKSPWRASQKFSNTVYIKDTLASARTTLDQLVKAIHRAEPRNSKSLDADVGYQELYIMRCATMAEEVYKVGWTRGSSYDRANELSSATGVPEALIVIGYWKHHDAQRLEADVHAALAPYRVTNRREFFRVSSVVIVRVIEQILQRATKLE